MIPFKSFRKIVSDPSKKSTKAIIKKNCIYTLPIFILFASISSKLKDIKILIIIYINLSFIPLYVNLKVCVQSLLEKKLKLNLRKLMWWILLEMGDSDPAHIRETLRLVKWTQLFFLVRKLILLQEIYTMLNRIPKLAGQWIAMLIVKRT